MVKYDLYTVLDNYSKYLKKFIFFIYHSLDDELKKKHNLERIKYLAITAIENEPLIVLQDSGKYLYGFRNEIKNKELEKLLIAVNNNDNKIIETINVARQEFNKKNKKNVKDSNIHKMLVVVNKMWNKYSDDERKKINKLLMYLVSEYAKYLTIKED